MATYNNSFETIASGSAVTTANSGGSGDTAFSNVTGTITSQSTAALFGAVGMRASLTNSTQSYAAWAVSGSTHYIRIYFKTLPGATTHNARMVWHGIAGSGTEGWDLRQIVSTERVGIATRNTTRFELGPDGGGTGVLARSTWYRLEARVVTGTAGTIEARLYDESGMQLDSNTYNGAVDATTELHYGLGNGPASPTTSTMDYDYIGYSDTAWLGPYSAPPPSAIRLNNFDGIASGVAVTSANSGGASGDAFDVVVGSMTAQTSSAYTGARGVLAQLNNSTQSYAGWTVGGSTHYVRIYFKTLSGATTHNARMVWHGIAGSTTDGWDLRQIVSTERVGIATRNTTRFELGPTGSGTGVLARSTWYRLEAKVVTGATGSIEARLYDSGGTLLDSNTYSGAIDATTELHYGLGNGPSSPWTATMEYDAIGYSSQDWLGGVAPPNQSPTVSITASPSPAKPYETVTLTVTAADPDGTTPSVTISQTGGLPSVTLSGTGLTRTFEAPAVMNGTELYFNAVASDGTASTSDSTSVVVYPHSDFVRKAGVWQPRRIRRRASGQWQ